MAWILRGHRHDLKLRIVGSLRLGWRDVADRLEQTPMVEPIDPFECGELNRLERAPRTPPMDHLGLEQPDDGFRQSIVVRVPTLPTDGSIPASARRSVYLIDTY